ncbi:MAG: phage major capsid protein, partial [Planctomycetota bacterium]
MSLQELREKREKIKAEVRNIRDQIETRRKEGSEILNAEERTKFDKLKEEFRTVNETIDAEERAADVSSWLDDIDKQEQRNRSQGGPTPDSLVPGDTDRTYGDDHGNNRDRIRAAHQLEERRAIAFAAWANKSIANTEQRDALNAAKLTLEQTRIESRGWSKQRMDRVRRSARFLEGEARSMAIDRAVDHLESRAVAGAAVREDIVPQVLVGALEKAYHTIGGLVGVAHIIPTDTGAPMTWPTGNDTGNEGKQVDEVTEQPVDGTDPEFSRFTLGMFEFWSDYVRVGNATLRDTPFNLAAELGMMLGERLARIHNRRATTGSGTNTLKGITVDTTVGREMTSANAYVWEDLKRLKYSVDARHRENGQFMLNDETLLEFMILKDGNDRPLLVEPNGDDPGRLMGRPYVINNHMATPEQVAANAGTVAVLFGNLYTYKLRLEQNVTYERADEKFQEFNQKGFLARRGADGGLLNAGTPELSPVKAL